MANCWVAIDIPNNLEKAGSKVGVTSRLPALAFRRQKKLKTLAYNNINFSLDQKPLSSGRKR